MKRNAFPAFLLTVALSVSAALAQGPGGGGGFNPGGGDQPGGGGAGGTLVYDDFLTACTTNNGILLRDGIAIGATGTATSLAAPSGMTAILPGAFAGNTAITSANLSSATGLTEIPASAFAGCTALKTVTLPASVTAIGEGAFAGCAALATLTAPGVESIGAEAFRGCTALKSQPAGTAIGDYAFAQSGLTSAALADAALGVGVCYGCKSLAAATFPDELPDATFAGCTALSMDPSGLVSIGAAALAGVPFGEITLAASQLGDYALAADTAWEAWTLTWTGTAATNETTFLGRGSEPAAALAIGAIAPQTYTGRAIEPALTVTKGGEAVTGYTAAWADNTHAGTASVTVAYAGETASATFEIAPADIAEADISGVAESYVVGNGPAPVLAFNGQTLAEGTDYGWTVTGGGSGTATNAVAFDCAANYEGSFDGVNGGTGFPAAWTVSVVDGDGNDATGTGNGGTWTDAEKGFGLWVSNGCTTKIRRTLPRALQAGDAFSFTLTVGDVVENAGEGAGVCSSGDEDAGFRIWFNGGGANFATSAGETSIGWTREPVVVTLTMTGSLSYTAAIATAGQETCTLEGAFSEACDTFRAWSWSNKGDDAGKDYDFHVDDLLLEETVAGGTDDWRTTPGDYVAVFAGKGDFAGTAERAFAVVAAGGTVETEIGLAGAVSFDPETGALSVTLESAEDLAGGEVKVYVASDLTDEDAWTEAEGVSVAISGTTVTVEGLAFGGTPCLFLRFGKE